MAKVQNRRKKSAALIVAAGMTVAGTGVAYAYWTSTGEGVGTATTGQNVGFTVSSELPEGDPLAPGSGDAQTVAFTVHNPSTGVQNLTGVTVAVANADGSPWVAFPGCSALDYTVSITSTNPAAPTQVAPDDGAPGGADDVTGVATITMNNLDSNQDVCQNKTVPLYFFAGTQPV